MPTSPAPAPSTSSPAPAPVSTPQGTSPVLAAAAQQVLTTINTARAQYGLPAYTMSSGLVLSATRHNAVMAGGCGLSHQCPGEPPLGTRETDAGVHWSGAGECIGSGGPVTDSVAGIGGMAVALTKSMLAEKPPNDGHRQIILSNGYYHVGIAVTIDSHGVVRLTQDYSD